MSFYLTDTSFSIGRGKKQVTLAGQSFQGQIIKVYTKYWQIEEAEIFFKQCTMGQSQT